MTRIAATNTALSVVTGLFLAGLPLNVAFGSAPHQTACIDAYLANEQASNFKLGQYLGAGSDGAAFRVSQDGKPYVIKIFRQTTEISRRDPEIAIQQLLAERGFAPKIVKILNADDLDALETFNRKSAGFLKWHFGEKSRLRSLLSYGSSAIIMEEIVGQSLKNPNTGPHRTIRLTEAQLQHAIEKIFEIDQFLRETKIFPNDLDVVFTGEGNVQFIDLSKFKYTKHEYVFARRVVGDLLALHFMKYIEVEETQPGRANAMILTAIERAREQGHD